MTLTEFKAYLEDFHRLNRIAHGGNGLKHTRAERKFALKNRERLVRKIKTWLNSIDFEEKYLDYDCDLNFLLFDWEFIENQRGVIDYIFKATEDEAYDFCVGFLEAVGDCCCIRCKNLRRIDENSCKKVNPQEINYI